MGTRDCLFHQVERSRVRTAERREQKTEQIGVGMRCNAGTKDLARRRRGLCHGDGRAKWAADSFFRSASAPRTPRSRHWPAYSASVSGRRERGEQARGVNIKRIRAFAISALGQSRFLKHEHCLSVTRSLSIRGVFSAEWEIAGAVSHRRKRTHIS
ncbi:hypothetical protein MRB53_039699 [Persea americana]|nr:hypothetical protein MRB53_039699 [Persea americana]